MESIETVRVRQIGVRVNTREYAILEGMAKRWGRSMSEVVRTLFLRAALEETDMHVQDLWREVDEGAGALAGSAAGGAAVADRSRG